MALPDGVRVRVAGYVRVSSEEQAKEGYSLPAQEKSVRAYCTARGWRLVKIYRDEGVSAYKGVRRPAYEAMMGDLESWDAVVVWKLNRLHRTMRGFVDTATKLAEASKDLVSITEAIDTSSPMGRFIYNLIGALSQLESEQTGERVRLAFAEKFESDMGGILNRPPLGYAMEGSRLLVVPSEAEIVRTIYRLCSEGLGLHDIVAKLEALGHRGKNGGRFELNTSAHILRNPIYAGYAYYSGHLKRNGHEAIISDDLYNTVQVALYVRARKAKRCPLIVGPDRLEVERVTMGPKPTAPAIYVPRERPRELDALVASYMVKVGRRSIRDRTQGDALRSRSQSQRARMKDQARA